MVEKAGFKCVRQHNGKVFKCRYNYLSFLSKANDNYLLNLIVGKECKEGITYFNSQVLSCLLLSNRLSFLYLFLTNDKQQTINNKTNNKVVKDMLQWQ